MKGWITLLPLALLAACASPRRVRTVPIERVTKDTVVVRSEQVDSIYVRQERTAERLHDTLLLSERTTEYRYRLLRDRGGHVAIVGMNPHIARLFHMSGLDRIIRQLDKHQEAQA